MGKILVYTNLTGSTDVLEVERYLSFSEFDFEFETIYYNHATHDHSRFDKVFALIDTGCIVVSDEFKNDLLQKVDALIKKNVRIVLCNFWESEQQIMETDYPTILKDYEYDIWHGDKTYFWYLMQTRYISRNFYFDHSKKQYDFLYLNKAQRPHRDLLFDSLMKEDVLSNSLYSYHHRGISLKKEYEIPQYRDSYPRYGADRDLYERPYNSTAMNLVSETSADEIFMTEKIWKPIVARQPFIVHADYGYLKELRALGFKTFAKQIDETYDDTPNLTERTAKIVSLCKSIKAGTHKNLYESTRSIRDHNYRIFFDKDVLKSKVNDSLRRFLKFVN